MAQGVGSQASPLRTVVVDGPLALRMRRQRAAAAGDIGLQIFTLPQLAARLAGGFLRPAGAADLEPAVRGALSAGGLPDLDPIAELPGMARAVTRTLECLWRSGFRIAEAGDRHPRLADIAELDARVRGALPGGVLAPPDLLAAALVRADLAGAVVGDLELATAHHAPAVWAPMIAALAGRVQVRWLGAPPPGWAGKGQAPSAAVPAAPRVVACAHPQAEVIEALRWARALLASGRARPHEIAIAAAAPGQWDDALLGMAMAAELPVHFSHGVPALSTPEGQACAALADLLAQGLSQDRVRRVVAHGAGRAAALADLPETPLQGVAADAGLHTVEQWAHALEVARARRDDGADASAALLALVRQASQRPADLSAFGQAYLPSGAHGLWSRAMRAAPPEGLSLALARLRTPDGRDPGACIAWAPAGHLSGAPRPFVRLLGLTARGWPRRADTDPLLPEHILSLDQTIAPSRAEQDRRDFTAICAAALGEVVLSYGQRNRQGGRQIPSPLLPRQARAEPLRRLRVPEHAFSESDRLQARPDEARTHPAIARAVAAVRARRHGEVTPWDGIVRADHPVLLRALADPQSASSLRRLVRDPLGYLWRYGLGWRSRDAEPLKLELDERAFGELVHALLQRTVNALEPAPGLVRASRAEIEAALADAVEAVRVSWPTERNTPPLRLWRHTLASAAALVQTALSLDETFQAGTRSWTEVGFGEAGQPDAPADPPWDPALPVPFAGASITIRGRIDRLELTAGDLAARVTDYKTGRTPDAPGAIVLDGGGELQRVLYAVAVRHHRPDARIRAHLVYLRDGDPQRHGPPNLEAAIASAAGMFTVAVENLRQGRALPGPDAEAGWNPYRLALPADADIYIQRKATAARSALQPLPREWAAP